MYTDTETDTEINTSMATRQRGYETALQKQQRSVAQAVIGHNWAIAGEYRSCCNIYTLAKCKLHFLLDIINTDHDYIDTLNWSFSGHKFVFKVNYINGSTEHLTKLVDEKQAANEEALISFRYSERYDIAIALIMLRPDPKRYFSYKILELQSSEFKSQNNPDESK